MEAQGRQRQELQGVLSLRHNVETKEVEDGEGAPKGGVVLVVRESRPSSLKGKTNLQRRGHRQDAKPSKKSKGSYVAQGKG